MCRYKGFPEDIYSKKGSTGVDCKFDLTLMTDIARQSRMPMTLTSIDASQCYDRVLHLILGMVWFSLVKSKNVIVTIISCLQLMEYFMRSRFGDSNASHGGRLSSFRWDGLGQGSHMDGSMCVHP